MAIELPRFFIVSLIVLIPKVENPSTFEKILLLMEEVLACMMKVEFERGQIGKFYHPLGYPLISHLLYADDLLVFMNVKCIFLKQLLKTIGMCERWFEQSINNAKSAISFLAKINSVRRKGFP